VSKVDIAYRRLDKNDLKVYRDIRLESLKVYMAYR